MKKSAILSVVLLTLAPVGMILALGSDEAAAYPNGPKAFVTNAAPYCAGCHSVTKPEAMRGMPEDYVNQELAANKHYKALEEGTGAYMEVPEDERKQLLEHVKLVDDNASVTISGPSMAKANEEVEVVVQVKGGAGPAIGVLLVDADVRFQASPIQARGWLITAAPSIKGSDGQAQMDWLNTRLSDLGPGINFAIIDVPFADLANKTFPTAEVTYRLRAPHDPGSYQIYAAFLHGTEKASPVGFIQQIGYKLPRGGFTAPSGRILFSAPLTVEVQ